MSAHRVCACGAELVVTGDTLFCFGCGRRARTWRVVLDGRVVALAATPWNGGIGGTVEFAPEFEAGLLTLCDEGSPEHLRYHPSSGRRRGHHTGS